MKDKLRENGISIKKFLRLYLGINDPKVLDSRISHKALKYLCPSLKRLPYNYVFNNIKLVLSGDIVVVIDDYGSYIPYESPQAQFNIDENYTYKEPEKAEKQDPKEMLQVEELEKCSTFELSKICDSYKKANRTRDYRIAYRVLKNKKEKEKKSEKYRRGKGLI